MSIPFFNFFRQLSYIESIFIVSKLFSLLPTIHTLQYKVIIFNLYTLNIISYSTNKNYPKKYVTVIIQVRRAKPFADKHTSQHKQPNKHGNESAAGGAFTLTRCQPNPPPKKLYNISKRKIHDLIVD